MDAEPSRKACLLRLLPGDIAWVDAQAAAHGVSRNRYVELMIERLRAETTAPVPARTLRVPRAQLASYTPADFE